MFFKRSLQSLNAKFRFADKIFQPFLILHCRRFLNNSLLFGLLAIAETENSLYHTRLNTSNAVFTVQTSHGVRTAHSTVHHLLGNLGKVEQ